MVFLLPYLSALAIFRHEPVFVTGGFLFHLRYEFLYTFYVYFKKFFILFIYVFYFFELVLVCFPVKDFEICAVPPFEI